MLLVWFQEQFWTGYVNSHGNAVFGPRRPRHAFLLLLFLSELCFWIDVLRW